MTHRRNAWKRSHLYLFLLLSLGLLTSISVQGAITVTGNSSPTYTGADPWTIFPGNLRIGNTADGTMEVTAGSSVSNINGYLAYDPGTIADVNIIGADSLWTNQVDLYIGYQGDGTLRVGAGGTVTSVDGYLAHDPNATGQVTVTGADSLWQNTASLFVGYAGDANMVVADGGSVTSYSGSLGEEDGSYGVVTVTGAGSSWANGYYLNIGNAGDANMVIADGGSVTSYSSSLGEEADGYGNVTVTGADSTWSNTDNLTIGNYGDGELTVEDGGQVTAGDSIVAIMPGSTGSVLVTDPDSMFETFDALVVGVWGQAQVQVSNGGQLLSDMAYIGGFDADDFPAQVAEVGYEPNGTGQMTVTGDGSSWVNEGTAYIGYSGDGTMLITNGGQVSSTYTLMGFEAGSEGDVTVSGPNSVWGSGRGLGVGIFGDGDLVVEDGAQIGSLESGIGVGLNSVGTVEITDANSLWTNVEEMAVGIVGTGTLTVSNGGRVTSADTYIGGMDPEAPNVDVEALLGGTLDGTGLVQVTGSGSRFDSSGFLYVGYTGTGTLDVNDGGLVTSEYGGVGADPNGTGTVTITDAGSQWSVSNDLVVGAYGQGDLTIASGGLVDANVAYIGGFDTDVLGGDVNDVPTGTGTITVTGTGSELDIADFLYVGYTGTGTLDVNDGALVSSAYGGVGADPNSTGTATITGTGSRWSIAEGLAVGAYGEGSLAISSGGLVDANEVYIGGFDVAPLGGDANDVPTGTGALTVSGAGSELEVDGTLYAGYSGDGTLVINNGGQVQSDAGSIGYLAGSSGSVVVTGAGSLWDIDNGLYVGGNDATAGGTAVLDINDSGTVTADEVIIWDDGTLSGDGTLTVPTVTNFGTIAPGNSIGTLTIDGDLTMDANSVLAVEVDNDDNSDLLQVTGDVEIEGGTVQVSSEETIRGTHEYTIMDANSVTGEFDVLDTALLRAGAVTADLGYGATAVTLEVTALGFDIGETRNQRSLGVGLQEIAVGGGNAITTLLQNVPTDAELLDHYDQLAGQSRPSLAPIGVAGTSQFMGTVSDRLRRPASMSTANAFGTDVAGQAGPDAGSGNGMSYEITNGRYNFAVGNGTPYLSDSKWGFWGKGHGLFGSRDDDVEAPGYDYTIYGLSFGLDCQVTETMLLGVTAGYSDGDVDYDRLNDSTDLSATHFGLYGSWDFESLYLDSLVSYTDLEYETKRSVDLTDERLEGDFDGYAFSGYFETGFDWRRINGWMLQPLASFQFAYLDLDEYTETGGDAALGYDDQTFESYKSGLGVKVTKNLLKDEVEKSLVAQFRARWLHEFGDTHSVVDTYFASDPATVFAVRDEAISRDSAVLGAGLGAQLNRQMSLYADYDVRLNADDTAHLVSAGLRYQW